MNMPRSLSVVYCFPRSGGTVLSQCLLCHPDNLLLSEINPAGSVEVPEKQAAEWLGLVTATECTELRNRRYVDKIGHLHSAAVRAGRHLCVRDWSGVNFLPHISPRHGQPSRQLEQRLYLQREGYTLREVAFLRRAWAVYRSLCQHIPEYRDLPVADFCTGYEAYLRQLGSIPRFHLETFLREPRQTLTEMCAVLDLRIAPDFETRFHTIRQVTGNTTLAAAPASASWTNLRSQPVPSGLEISFPDAVLKMFGQLDHLAGYDRAQ